jgi:hypothetical protein
MGNCRLCGKPMRRINGCPPDLRAQWGGLHKACAARARKCMCTFGQRVAGDGCQYCNPKLAAELRKERP